MASWKRDCFGCLLVEASFFGVPAKSGKTKNKVTNDDVCFDDILFNFLFDRPQNVPRLYDLVRVKDDQIRTAFYFALRDTLVANDLKQATDIAYQVKPLNVAVSL